MFPGPYGLSTGDGYGSGSGYVDLEGNYFADNNINTVNPHNKKRRS